MKIMKVYPPGGGVHATAAKVAKSGMERITMKNMKHRYGSFSHGLGRWRTELRALIGMFPLLLRFQLSSFIPPFTFIPSLRSMRLLREIYPVRLSYPAHMPTQFSEEPK